MRERERERERERKEQREKGRNQGFTMPVPNHFHSLIKRKLAWPDEVCQSYYTGYPDNSAKDRSANANSAKETTVRMRQICEGQVCEGQECEFDFSAIGQNSEMIQIMRSRSVCLQDEVRFFFLTENSLSVSLFLSRVRVRVGSLSPTDGRKTGP